MGVYSLTVETTSNATAGSADSNAVAQFLMASGRDARLLAVLIKPQELSNTQHSGQWVIDRISAVGTASSLTPLKMDATSPASAITDTSKTISTTVAAANTHVDAAILQLADGWNFFTDPKLVVRAGAGQGFALRRATAPSGSQTVDCTMIWEEI